MYCTNCGAKNEDDAKFCVKCGRKIDDIYIEINTTENQPYVEQMMRKEEEEVRKRIKIIPIIILVILVAVVIVFPKFIISGQAEKKVIGKFVKAEMTGDTEIIIDILPEKVIEMEKTETGMGREQLAEEIRKQFDSAINTLETTYGEDWKYSYKINSIKKFSQEALEDLKDTYSEELKMNLDISEAKTTEIEVNVNGNESENTIRLVVNFMKIENKWYLDFASFASFM